MKFIANVQALKTALSAVKPIVPTRSPKVILQSVLLDIDEEGGAVLIASDLEVSIRCRVLGIQASAAGKVVLNPETLGKALQHSQAIDLNFDVSEDKVKITGKGLKYEFPTEDPTLFPSIPTFAAVDCHQIPERELLRLIELTSFACDTASNRYAMGGTYFEFQDQFGLIGVATDGRRLALAKTKTALATGNGGDFKGTKVIPLKALKFLTSFLSDNMAKDEADHDMAEIAFTTQSCMIRTDRGVVHTRLLEGRFPRYEDVLVSLPQCGHKATIVASRLSAACKQAEIVTSEESKAIKFEFEPEPPTLTLRGTSQNRGVSETTWDLSSYSGRKFVFRVDPTYLTAMLASLEADALITIGAIDNKTGILFTTGDDYSYVVMPLTSDEEDTEEETDSSQAKAEAMA